MYPSMKISSGGIELAAYEWNASKTERPTLLFVHGYPDNARTWRPVIQHLLRDFRIAAYDVRGAGLSDKPWRTSNYRIPYLMQDLEAVIDRVSPNGPVHLIAHDWGSIQSWHGVCSDRLRKRIVSYTSISGPCLDHVSFWLRDHLQSGDTARMLIALNQLRHSWYMGAYQLPGFAPSMWHSGLGPRVLKALDSSHRSTDQRLKSDGSVGAKLYRANLLPRLRDPPPLRTDLPVQLIVPTADPFATTPLYDQLESWAPNLWRKDIDAQHWVLHTHPRWLAAQIREFVERIESGADSSKSGIAA